MIANQAECSTAESHTIFWITNLDCDLTPILQLIQTLQKTISQNQKSILQNQEICHAIVYQIQKVLRQKSKSFFKSFFSLKEKDYCCILQPKADHQGSKIPFRDFRWIGPYLIEKVLLNNNYIVQKLNTNKTQILHRICLRKYNAEKPPEDNYEETKWQIDDKIVIPKDKHYTIAWEAEFGGHLFDIPIIYTDPNAIDFDESYTQGTDTVIVACSFFKIQAMVKTGKLAPFLTHLYNYLQNLNGGQSQGTETNIDLAQNDNSEQIFEPSTDTETTCEPTTQPPLRQSDTPATLEIDDPTAKSIPLDEPSHLRGDKYNLRPNPNPKYSELYRY